MALKAKVLGREALTRRLNALAPNVEKYAAEAKMRAAEDLADAIRAVAPRVTGGYADSIYGDLLNTTEFLNRVGIQASKDPSATGIFAKFIWRFLEFGTATHSTVKGGGTVLGKKTASATSMHPGTAAQPHIFPTYRAMKKKIKRRIATAVNKAVREAQGK